MLARSTARSSSLKGRPGEYRCARGPRSKRTSETPSRSSRRAATGLAETTPMLPVSVPGAATTCRAAHAT